MRVHLRAARPGATTVTVPCHVALSRRSGQRFFPRGFVSRCLAAVGDVTDYPASRGYSAYSHQVLGVSHTVTEASCMPWSRNLGLRSRWMVIARFSTVGLMSRNCGRSTCSFLCAKLP